MSCMECWKTTSDWLLDLIQTFAYRQKVHLYIIGLNRAIALANAHLWEWLVMDTKKTITG